MKDWLTIDYLIKGSFIQQKTYEILKELNLFHDLKEFDPILIGTIPIGLYIKGSDIDIACNMKDKEIFKERVNSLFSNFSSFIVYNHKDKYMAAFSYKNLPIEIYAESCNTIMQNGFRHMMIEYRILQLTDKKFRENILELKRKGVKTEPAFGELLSMSQPYEDLLTLEKMDMDSLALFLKERGAKLRKLS